MQTAEIELKFPIHNLAGLQSRLPGLGFRLDTPRTFEQNTLYDTPSRSLRAVKQILRIRHYGDLWIVTHKRPADSSADGGPASLGTAANYGSAASYKVRIETETLLTDGPALAAIFHQLGYEPVFRYEKFRTEWSHTTPTIDGPLFTDPSLPNELPIGRLRPRRDAHWQLRRAGGPPRMDRSHPGPAQRRSRLLPHRQLRHPLPRLEAAHWPPRR